MPGSNNSEPLAIRQKIADVHQVTNADLSIKSGHLFGENRQVTIEHDGQTYRLHITRSNKLILTK